MRYAAILVLACVSCGPVPVVAQQMTPAEIEATCAMERGCVLISRQRLEALLLESVLQALILAEAEHKAKPAPTCRRSDT